MRSIGHRLARDHDPAQPSFPIPWSKKSNSISVDIFDSVEYILYAVEYGGEQSWEYRRREIAAGRQTPVELTEAEWEIMKVVWEKEPCAAGTVQEELAAIGTGPTAPSRPRWTGWSRKDSCKIEKIRNLQLFSSCVSEVEARRGEFRRMLKRAFDGALTPMMQFLIEHEGLSAEEASQLRELIDKTEGKKGGR